MVIRLSTPLAPLGGVQLLGGRDPNTSSTSIGRPGPRLTAPDRGGTLPDRGGCGASFGRPWVGLDKGVLGGPD